MSAVLAVVLSVVLAVKYLWWIPVAATAVWVVRRALHAADARAGARVAAAKALQQELDRLRWRAAAQDALYLAGDPIGIYGAGMTTRERYEALTG